MSSEVKTITLHGVLGKKFGRRHRFAVESPAEAVRALCAMIPGITAFFMGAKDHGMEFAVYAGDRNLIVQELRYPSGDDEIKFVPIIVGASGSTIATIAGAVLIVVGVILIETPFGVPLIYAGAALMAGGIITMLMSTTKSDAGEGDKENRASYAFNGPVNTQAQGNPVPVAYGGPMFVGSAVVSASLEAKDDVYAPSADGATIDGAGGGGNFVHVNVNSIMDSP
jgi:predicted phage tail protein